MADGEFRLYPLFDALSGDMLLRPFYPNTPTPHYITLDQVAGFVGQGSIGPEGPEGPPGPAGPEGPPGPPGTGEGASGLSGMVAGQIPIAATPTTVTSSAALSGDVTSNATLVTTLATVNSNVGTFQGLTVNAKGLVTAATNQSYLTTSVAASTYAPLASPALTGTPTAPTAGAGTTTTQIATTAFVAASFAPIGSPTFTGDPKAPTPATGDSDTSIATTAFVKAQNYLTANQSITLSGDVSGSGSTAISATVTQLQGRSVSASAPGTNQVLTWSGSAWAPADPTGGGGSGTITGVTAGTGLTGGGTTGTVTLNISVPVAVAHGGTGAIDAAAARTNLAVLPIASPTTTGKLTTQASATGGAGFNLPPGTAPSAPVNGDLWTTTSTFTIYLNSVGRIVAFLSGGTYTGKITTVTSATGTASITLPHGTVTPASPANGDMWTQASGLYVRINGVTQQYLPLSGGTLTGGLTINAGTASPLVMATDSGTACTMYLGVTGTRQWGFSINTIGEYDTYDAGASAFRMKINTSGACFNATGTWSTISEASLKQDIEPYERGLDAVLALKPIAFRYRPGTPFASKDEPSDPLLGLIVEDVAPHLPEIVGTTGFTLDGKEREYRTLAPGNLVYALVNACKELAAKNEALEARLVAIEELRTDVVEVLSDLAGDEPL